MNFVSKIKENPLLIFQAILIVLLIVLAIVFVVVMVSENPEWSFKLFGVSGSENPKFEALKFLGIGMGGILVALQALASHRRAKAMEDTAKTQVDAANAQADAAKAQANAAQAQARATEEQARANENTEQGLRQERLKNAIEHLGDEKDTVRLGGAYELFHLVEDSKGLRKTALDMLCLHIRQTTGEKEYQREHKSKPSEEVQSLLTLLFVQEHDVFKNFDINLQGSWLKGADLRKARLQEAILTGASLQEADLSRAHLQETNLEDAQLQGADLSRAHLQGADFEDAELQEADLSRAHLQGADLSWTQLQEADLSRAQLQGANLLSAELQEADLRWAQLQEADLRWAQLQGADLEDAQLQGASLIWAHLQGADLEDAQLQGASLIWAHLQGADFKDAQLQGASLYGAQLQGADLRRAQLQGTDLLEAKLHETHLKETDLRGSRSGEWLPWESFENHIRKQIDKETDLSDAIFAGGLKKKDMDALVEGLSNKKANKLRKRLEPHIKKKKRHKLPKKSGAITGAYTEEEAEKWITEYEEAMSEDPEGDS